MPEIEVLLNATDFSEDARHATRRAALLAATLNVRLELLHVVSEPSLVALRRAFGLSAGGEAKLIEDAERLLREQAAADAADVAAVSRVAAGDVHQQILAAAERSDLLILGARGAGRLRAMLIGTTAERLLGKCPRPVLAVKRPPSGPYLRVLVALDLSERSASAVELATLVAPHAQLTVVHAFRVPYQDKLWLAGVSQERIEAHRTRTRQEAQEKIAALVRTHAGDSGRFRSIVEQEDPAALILTRAEELEADLIVTGKRERLRAGEVLLGSVTRRVLAAAACDVLVAPD